MPLQRGEVQGYDSDRMTVEFTMLNQGKVIMCAISTAADILPGTIAGPPLQSPARRAPASNNYGARNSFTR